MAEENSIAASPETDDQQAKEQTEQQETSIDEIKSRLDKLEEENKRLKGSVSAKDKLLIALQKEKEELEKKGMSEAEQAKHDAEKEKSAYVSEVKAIYTESLNLDEETASLLDRNSVQEVKDTAKLLKDFKENILKEANLKIEELQKELNTLKGEMPNPGSGNKSAGGLSKLTTAELNELAIKEPSRLDEIIAEIKSRNKPK